MDRLVLLVHHQTLPDRQDQQDPLVPLVPLVLLLVSQVQLVLKVPSDQLDLREFRDQRERLDKMGTWGQRAQLGLLVQRVQQDQPDHKEKKATEVLPEPHLLSRDPQDLLVLEELEERPDPLGKGVWLDPKACQAQPEILVSAVHRVWLVQQGHRA